MKHNLLNHTPGPWYAEGHYIHGKNGIRFIAVSGDKNGHDAEANARLIAAAPEMYHALIAYRRAREDGGISMADYSTIAHNLLMKALDKVEKV